MDAQQVKEQMMKIEGLADGVKQGALIFAKWVLDELAKEQPKPIEEVK